jgi:hypothetical protein
MPYFTYQVSPLAKFTGYAFKTRNSTHIKTSTFGRYPYRKTLKTPGAEDFVAML